MLRLQRRNRFLEAIRTPWICLFLGIVCLIIITARTGYSPDITLAWDRNAEPDLAGYTIFCRRKEVPTYDYGAPAWVGRDPNQTTCIISQLDDTVTYCFVARAFDASGLESGDSNQVCYSPSDEPPVDPPILSNATVSTTNGTGSYLRMRRMRTATGTASVTGTAIMPRPPYFLRTSNREPSEAPGRQTPRVPDVFRSPLQTVPMQGATTSPRTVPGAAPIPATSLS